MRATNAKAIFEAFGVRDIGPRGSIPRGRESTELSGFATEGDLRRGQCGEDTRGRMAEVPVRFRPVAARNRDVELGVAPHAVLVHVEALRLDGRLDPDAPDLVQHPEAGERGAERERTDGHEA